MECIIKKKWRQGTRSDHVIQCTWNLPMLDMQVPGRVVGHDLVRKTLCLWCFQNAVPRKLPRETLQQTNMDPFKKEKKKKEKDMPTPHRIEQRSVCGCGKEAEGLWKGAVAVAAAAWVPWTSTLGEMHTSNAEVGVGVRERGGPVCADSLCRLVCLGKPSAGSSLAAEELALGTGCAANNSKWWRWGGSLWCCSPL